MDQGQDNSRGAIYMMVSMAAFTLNDTAIKMTGAELPVFQAIFLRGCMVTVLLLAIGAHQGVLRFWPSRADRVLIGWRTVAEVGATSTFLTALFHMPIANVTAVLQSLPLAVTLAAAVFLREPVGWRRLSAIGVGFLGVLLIVRPGPDGFDRYAILAIIAVGFVVLRDLTTRRLGSDVPSVWVALVTAIAITVTGAMGTLGSDWEPVSSASILTLAVASCFIVVGYTFAVMVMRVGEIAFVTPFRYSGILWAILTGWVVFSEFPDALTLAGIGVVVGTGLFMFYRERAIARRATKLP